MNKITSIAASAAAGLCLSVAANLTHAVEVTVRLTNLTQGMYFTPRLLVAHTGDLSLFTVGAEASVELANVAEGGVIGENGDPDTFATLLESQGVADLNAWSAFLGLLPPATTTADYTFDTEDFPFLSMVSMLVPTNDAFVGLNSWAIPTEAGTYTLELNAYDAGTEANDEISPVGRDGFGGTGLPGMATPPPTQPLLGTGGSGVAVSLEALEADPDAGQEGAVHIHRNVLGDTNEAGGISDLNATVHRWLNPVARITVIVPAASTAP